MKLKSLSIRRPYTYGAGKQQSYVGDIEFDDDAGEIKLILTEELSRRVLAACADEIVAATTAQAEALRNSAAQAVGILIDHEKEAEAAQ